MCDELQITMLTVTIKKPNPLFLIVDAIALESRKPAQKVKKIKGLRDLVNLHTFLPDGKKGI
tara:strand:- start:2599 stop:2784 length:186 start_codon:yes stop_codon:yes gene_type:complete